MKNSFATNLAFVAACCATAAHAQDDSDKQDLAKKLSNPVASLISVPLQFNYDQNIGPARDGDRYLVNFQPVLPVSLNDDWVMIARTIAPIVNQNEVAPGVGSQTGLGDITESLFFSPKEPTASGWIWGIGPILSLPSATDRLLGAGKWSAGPTFVVLRQQGAWTYGMLFSHVWSVGGQSNRPAVSSSFAQPFLSYNTPNAWTFTVQTESSYDWKQSQWSVPINLQVAKLETIGRQPVQFFLGARYWDHAVEAGPHGWGMRMGVTLLFPE